nr:hypothetical protein Iba_chr07fCG11790 [Ipomoea batatas]
MFLSRFHPNAMVLGTPDNGTYQGKRGHTGHTGIRKLVLKGSATRFPAMGAPHYRADVGQSGRVSLRDTQAKYVRRRYSSGGDPWGRFCVSKAPGWDASVPAPPHGHRLLGRAGYTTAHEDNYYSPPSVQQGGPFFTDVLLGAVTKGVAIQALADWFKSPSSVVRFLFITALTLPGGFPFTEHR